MVSPAGSPVTPAGLAGPPGIVKSLRRRRPLRAGVIQASYMAGGLALALLTPRVGIGPMADAGKVSTLLQAIGGGLVTFILLVFSLLFLVLQHANTTFSPRLVLFRDLPLVWHAMGLFVGVFVFATTASLVVARNIRVSIVVPGLAILLVLVSLGIARTLQLTAFAAVQLGLVVQQITARGLAAIHELYPRRGTSRPPKTLQLGPVSRQVHWPYQHGVVRQVDLPAMLALDQDGDSVIVVNAAVGAVLTMGSLVFTVHGPPPAATDAQLLALLEVGADHNFEQDPLFGFRLLNDIALRALSPAVNDPATAAQALNGIEDMLFTLLDRDMEIGHVRDAQGRLRVLLGLPTWAQFVHAGVETIPYSASSPSVRSRLSAMLDRLAADAPADRAAPLLAARQALT